MRPAIDYADLFQSAPIGYMLLDGCGYIEVINRSGAAILGWNPDWLVGKRFSRWVAASDRQLFEAHQRRIQQAERTVTQVLRIKNRQGCPIDVRMTGQREMSLASPPEDAGFQRCRCTLIDISADEQSAYRLRLLRKKLAHAARLHTAGEFAARLAHELNQPLGTVLLSCEEAMRLIDVGQGGADELKDVLGQACDAATFASAVVRRLRTFVGAGDEHRCNCEVHGLVDDVATLVEADARDHQVQLQRDLPEGLPGVHADPVQIQQVLINLIRNAIEAMSDLPVGAPRQVRVSAREQSSDQLRFTVHDTGPGLSGAQSEQIFNMFFTTKARGMGIGLAISRTIVEAHGGRIWIADSPPQQMGLAIAFTVPTATEERDGN